MEHRGPSARDGFTNHIYTDMTNLLGLTIYGETKCIKNRKSYKKIRKNERLPPKKKGQEQL